MNECDRHGHKQAWTGMDTQEGKEYAARLPSICSHVYTKKSAYVDTVEGDERRFQILLSLFISLDFKWYKVIMHFWFWLKVLNNHRPLRFVSNRLYSSLDIFFYIYKDVEYLKVDNQFKYNFN